MFRCRSRVRTGCRPAAPLLHRHVLAIERPAAVAGLEVADEREGGAAREVGDPVVGHDPAPLDEPGAVHQDRDDDRVGEDRGSAPQHLVLELQRARDVILFVVVDEAHLVQPGGFRRATRELREGGQDGAGRTAGGAAGDLGDPRDRDLADRRAEHDVPDRIDRRDAVLGADRQGGGKDEGEGEYREDRRLHGAVSPDWRRPQRPGSRRRPRIPRGSARRARSSPPRDRRPG